MTAWVVGQKSRTRFLTYYRLLVQPFIGTIVSAERRARGVGPPFYTPRRPDLLVRSLWISSGTNTAGVKPRQGVDRTTLNADFEVQVRSGGVSSVAEFTDLLASLDALADLG